MRPADISAEYQAFALEDEPPADQFTAMYKAIAPVRMYRYEANDALYPNMLGCQNLAP
jgi:hypothetical protein